MQEPKYTDEQRCEVVDLRFRDAPRPMPWRGIAAAINTQAGDMAIERLLWGVVTGYPTNNDPHGPRRDVLEWPTGMELYRADLPWHPPEDEALQMALSGAGQKRDPVVDVDYIAQVLARAPEEIAARWKALNKDELGRKGFGFV